MKDSAREIIAGKNENKSRGSEGRELKDFVVLSGADGWHGI